MKRAPLVVALSVLCACEAEPARDRANAERDAQVADAEADFETVDRGVPDGGIDGEVVDAAVDQGVTCSDTLVGEPVYRLVVLHAGGGESALVSETDHGGAARFIARLRQLQIDAREVEGSAVISLASGDSFLAGATFAVSLERGIPFYDGQVLAAGAFDAIALGNHDFDFGPQVLADFIQSTQPGVPGGPAAPPFLATNLDLSGEPALQALVESDRLVRSAVVESDGRRIGIVGATTALLGEESSPGAVVVLPAAEAVQAAIDALTADGIDIIILLSHLEDQDAERALLARLRGVDLAFGGGSDALRASELARLLPGDEPVGRYPIDVCGADGRFVPLANVPGSYRYIGRLLAGFDSEGRLVRVDPRSDPVRVIGGEATDAVEPDPQVEAEVEAPVRAALEALAETEVGRLEVPLDGLRARLRSVETNLGNLVADALLWAVEEHVFGTEDAPADVAIMNGGGIRNNTLIPPGAFSELDTFAVLPFASFVVRIPAVSRQELKDALENGVSQVEAGAGRFPQVAGMRFTWQPSAQPRTLAPDGTVLRPGNRIREITLDDDTRIVEDGRVVPGDPLVVATIDFLADGGDQFPFPGGFETFGVSYQRALRDYIAGAMEGEIRASRYPEGGSGRIQRIE